MYFFIPTVIGQVKVVVLSGVQELQSVSAVLINPSNTKFHGNLLTPIFELLQPVTHVGGQSTGALVQLCIANSQQLLKLQL